MSAGLGFLWAWVRWPTTLPSLHQPCGLWLCGPLRRRRGRVHLAGGGSAQAHLPVGAGPEGHGWRRAHHLRPGGVPGLVGLRRSSVSADANVRPAVPDNDLHHRPAVLCNATHTWQPVDRSCPVVPCRCPGCALFLGVQPDLGLIAAGVVGVSTARDRASTTSDTETMITRRQFAASTPLLAASAFGVVRLLRGSLRPTATKRSPSAPGSRVP